MKEFLHHLFFPRESNNHRSKLLHHDSLLLLICLLLFGASVFAVVQNTHPQVLGISANISVQDLLSLTNQKRLTEGLPPLTLNSELSVAASQKAQHMFVHNYWAHVAPDGTTPWFFIKNSGYEYLYAGENLARGFTTAPDVVDAWMASPTHRANMLSSNYNEIGFAILPGSLTGSETVLVVEMLGTRYLAKNQQEQQELAVPTPEPTVFIVQQIFPSLVPSVLPTQSPTPVISKPTPVPQGETTVVAAVQNQPLIDSKSMTRQVSFFLLFLLIAVLIIDALIVERKKIARVVSHNVDHIIFLTIIILAAILIGKGAIL